MEGISRWIYVLALLTLAQTYQRKLMSVDPSPSSWTADTLLQNPGTSDCPCIDPLLRTANDDILDPNFNQSYNTFPGTYNGVIYNFSKWFGSVGCQPYHSYTPYCDSSPEPDTCSSSWCFVDSRNCTRPYQALTALIDENIGLSNLAVFDPPATLLGYSFETCGFLADYSQAWAEDYLEGLEIDVVYPFTLSEQINDGWGTYMFYWKEDSIQPTGQVAMFMFAIFNQLGVIMNEISVSEASISRYPSEPYWQCVHEVAIGGADLCLADTWATAERRIIATFTSLMSSDQIKLAAKISSAPPTVSELVGEVFKPFDSTVWLLILAVCVATSLCMVLLEGYANFRDFPDKEPLPINWQALYHSIISVFNGGPDFDPMTGGGQIISMGFGIFIMMILSNYTAALASLLVLSTTSTQVNNIDEAMSTGGAVCVSFYLEDSIRGQLPTIGDQLHLTNNTAESIDRMHNGQCEFALISMVEAVDLDHKIFGSDCDIVVVGDAVTTFGFAMAVKPEIEPALSWAITYYVSVGWFDDQYAAVAADYYNEGSCSASAGSTGADASLDLLDLAGLFIITLCFTLVGVLLSLLIERGKNFKEIVKEWQGETKVHKNKQDDIVDELIKALEKRHVFSLNDPSLKAPLPDDHQDNE